ncbi:MAG TPA: YgiT-type zinc finger protein, partial [Sedimentibacter sp.]|nr:YgiT-type zinc finger protein [Sedimentibacter sp.]
MSKKCYICGSEMEMKKTSIDSGWGEYNLKVEGVNAYVCPECDEVILEGEMAMMLQKLSKSLESLEVVQRPDVI